MSNCSAAEYWLIDCLHLGTTLPWFTKDCPACYTVWCVQIWRRKSLIEAISAFKTWTEAYILIVSFFLILMITYSAPWLFGALFYLKFPKIEIVICPFQKYTYGALQSNLYLISLHTIEIWSEFEVISLMWTMHAKLCIFGIKTMCRPSVPPNPQHS